MGLATLPEFVRRSNMEELIEDIFHCMVMQPLCKLFEGFMVCILCGNFLVLEASSVCNVVLPLDKKTVFLYLHNIMRIIIWMITEEIPLR